MTGKRRYRAFASKILLGGLEEARHGMIEELGEFLSNGRYEVFCAVAGIDKERYRTECQMLLSVALEEMREAGQRCGEKTYTTWQ